MNCARKAWTDLPDVEASCQAGRGTLADREEIARLLHDRNTERPKERLKREELFPPKSPHPVRNVCADPLGSSGASLTRCEGLSDDDLRCRSKEYAEQKEGRAPRGASVGSAGAVRAVRSKITPGVQVVFAYDDPTVGDAGHCVIRCHTAFRSEGDYLRTEILSALSRSVPQDS